MLRRADRRGRHRNGRLTFDIIDRGREVVAIEPAAPMRKILERELADASHRGVRVLPGFFDDLPLPCGYADLVVACSAFTPALGTAEMMACALELSENFYPRAAEMVRSQHLRRVPFELVGINPPRDVAYKVLPR